MDENELKQLLSTLKKISPISRIERITGTTFLVIDGETGSRFTVKVVNKNTGRGIRGIENAKHRSHRMKDLVQPVTEIIYLEDSIIALLDWVTGDTLKERRRELLPAFFFALKRWHKSNIDAGPIYSPYTRSEYETIAEFIESEVSYHVENANITHRKRACIENLEALNHGFVTVIHGDVHPGNILKQKDRFVLLDPEYVHCSINVLDLGYIEASASSANKDENERPWWAITAYAQQCVDMYFADEQIGQNRINEIMHSVEILSALQSISNSSIFCTGNTRETIERLFALLE